MEELINLLEREGKYCVVLSTNNDSSLLENIGISDLDKISKAFLSNRKGFLISANLTRLMLSSLWRQGLVEGKVFKYLDSVIEEIQDNVKSEIQKES